MGRPIQLAEKMIFSEFGGSACAFILLRTLVSTNRNTKISSQTAKKYEQAMASSKQQRLCVRVLNLVSFLYKLHTVCSSSYMNALLFCARNHVGALCIAIYL